MTIISTVDVIILFMQEVGIGESFMPDFAGYMLDLIQVLREVHYIL